VVRLVDATTAPDGRDYVFEVLGASERPRAGQPHALTVRLRPALGLAATGVDDEISQYLPPSLDLVFQDGSTATLNHIGFFDYSGTVRFPVPGVAFPAITFAFFDGQPITLTLRIEVDG
jgi:hypothetical protein